MEEKWISKIAKDVLENEIPTEFDDQLLKFLSISGDTYFNHPISKTALMIEKMGTEPVYEYIYSHQGSFSLTDLYRISLPQVFIKVRNQENMGIKYIYVEPIFQILGRFVGLDLYREEIGVGHTDELTLIFKGTALPLETVYTEDDKIVSNLLVKMLTSFAINGNPSVEGAQEWKRQGLRP